MFSCCCCSDRNLNFRANFFAAELPPKYRNSFLLVHLARKKKNLFKSCRQRNQFHFRGQISFSNTDKSDLLASVLVNPHRGVEINRISESGLAGASGWLDLAFWHWSVFKNNFGHVGLARRLGRLHARKCGGDASETKVRPVLINEHYFTMLDLVKNSLKQWAL